MADEQLLFVLHRALHPHAPEGKARTLMGTMYLGLTAVVMNGGGVLVPTSLPEGFVAKAVRSLEVSADLEGVGPAAVRYCPHLQHYGMHILQQCVRQRALRTLVATQEAADALLSCLAYPVTPVQRCSPTGRRAAR
eukprot:TRINITY_DN1441_c0_g1_i1.p4 TRINITY_DN1441_c0_g1~~TRINITY_DN1441_c0_g1_i1.p4  ORF type:complete len:136 (+),score=31.92 TRINITY_DN1441_c0_g1_i1:900-1307(+)